MLWEEAGLIVELDGVAGHGTGAQRSRDHERDLALRRAGYRVLRYSWFQVTKEAGAVAADIRRALASRR
jgi:very-short-patch-repair endonuclease